MHATVPAATLAAALKHAVAARATTMPVLQHVKVTAENGFIHLETSDCEIFVRNSVAAAIDHAGAVCLHAEKLRAIAAGAGDVVLRDDGRVNRGRSHFTVDALPADDFPSPEESRFAPVDIDPAALRQALDQAAYAYNDDDVRPWVGAVHIEPGRVWSTNGHQMGRAALPGYDGPAIRIPGAQLARVQAALQWEDAVLSVAPAGNPKTAAMLRVGNGHGEVIVRCIAGDVPDVETFVPRVKFEPLVLDRDAFAQALRRLQPFVLASSTKGEPIFTLEAGEGGVRLADKSAKGVEWLEPANPFDSAAINVGLNSRYVLAVLGAIDTDKVEVYVQPNNAGPALILPDGADRAEIAHVLMPYRM